MKKILNLKARVSCFASSDFLIVIDEKNRVFYFDDAFKLKKAFKLKLDNNDPDENSVKVSYNKKFALIAIKNILTLWDLENKKHLASFLQKNDILSVAFSKDDKYFASGNINGEVFVYNLKLRKKVYELKKHKDFITDLSFYEDRSYLVAGGYDECVIFHNLITLDKEEKYYHIKPVKKIEKENYLISCDAISCVVNWDEYKKDFKDITKFYKKFRDFFIFKNYLLLASDKNIAIYNLDNFVIESDNFLSLGDIDKITIFKNYLLISTISGEIYIKNLFEEENELLDLIIKEEYKKAFELINKNPFLKFSRGYKKLQTIIELEIKRAKELFLINEAQAIEILNKFLVVPELRNKIQKIIEEFKNYKKFVFAIKEENYALAYLLANRFELLKETKYYKLLEKKWQIAFERAKEYALKGDISKAKEILAPFMAVSEKLPLIKLLLQEAEIFKLLKEKLAKRDFKGFFDIIKNHPELKNTSEYEKVINYANSLYKLANKFLKEEKFEKAKKAALILQDIEGFEDKAQEILEKIEVALKFLHYIANKEYKKAIELSELYPFLKELQSYKNLIKKHNDIYEKVEEMMVNGEVKKAQELLNKEKIIKR